MLSQFWRHGLVVALALATGVLFLVMERPVRSAPALPPIAALTAGTGWQMTSLDGPHGWAGYTYNIWGLQNAKGEQASLYLAGTSKVQNMLHWSGELGFEGEGYSVVRRGTTRLRLRDGSVAPVSVVLLHRLDQQLLIEYAVMGPDGIAASSTDDLLGTAWDIARGAAGPYYLARVATVSQGDGAHAEATDAQLLSPVLSALKPSAR